MYSDKKSQADSSVVQYTYFVDQKILASSPEQFVQKYSSVSYVMARSTYFRALIALARGLDDTNNRLSVEEFIIKHSNNQFGKRHTHQYVCQAENV